MFNINEDIITTAESRLEENGNEARIPGNLGRSVAWQVDGMSERSIQQCSPSADHCLGFCGNNEVPGLRPNTCRSRMHEERTLYMGHIVRPVPCTYVVPVAKTKQSPLAQFVIL